MISTGVILSKPDLKTTPTETTCVKRVPSDPQKSYYYNFNLH